MERCRLSNGLSIRIYRKGKGIVMNYERSYIEKKVLTKDVLNKKLSGVCAGIAKFYNWPRLLVRVLAVLALITFPVVAGVAYIVAAMLLPSR
jgi:phage shock protein C